MKKKTQKGATSGLLISKGTHSLFALKPWYNKDTLADGRWWFLFLWTFNFKQTEPFLRPFFPDGLFPHASKMCQYLTISARCQTLTETASPQPKALPGLGGCHMGSSRFLSKRWHHNERIYMSRRTRKSIERRVIVTCYNETHFLI